MILLSGETIPGRMASADHLPNIHLEAWSERRHDAV
jgi:small nuclear ribonucleoprotein (snRNP)-like protein